MSSPVIPSNSEQNNVEANEEEEEEAEERNNLMHVDYFDSNKLIDFEERFVGFLDFFDFSIAWVLKTNVFLF